MRQRCAMFPEFQGAQARNSMASAGSCFAVRRVRPGEDLDSDAVRIEGEERVVVLAVLNVVALGLRLDRATGGDAAPVSLVDLGWMIDFERDVFDSDVVVPVLAAVRGPQAEPCTPNSR